jgi:hypothetical protein
VTVSHFTSIRRRPARIAVASPFPHQGVKHRLRVAMRQHDCFGDTFRGSGVCKSSARSGRPQNRLVGSPPLDPDQRFALGLLLPVRPGVSIMGGPNVGTGSGWGQTFGAHGKEAHHGVSAVVLMI